MSNRRKSSAKTAAPLSSARRQRKASCAADDVSHSSAKASSHKASTQQLKAKPEKGTGSALPLSSPVVDPTLQQLLDFETPVAPVCPKQLQEEAAAERIEEAKEALGKLEGEIISALFPTVGLPESLEVIASRLGMTVKEVRDVADNALRGLRGTKSSRPRLSTVWN